MSRSSHYRKALGLTLIEVLIALAIIGIAMTAIIKATSQNIRSTNYLQNKTVAMWVGQEVLNELRLGTLKLVGTDESVKRKMNMLDHDWYWQAREVPTPNKHIKKMSVQVFMRDAEAEQPVITLETYLYHVE